MEMNITPNGNLRLSAEPLDQEMLQTLFERCGHDDSLFLLELLDATGWLGNARLAVVRPEQIGALTDAPILSDEIAMDDNGDIEVLGKVWWFPDYMVKSLPEQLCRTGEVVLTLAH